MAWCVVNTIPNQETRAEENLLRQGFRIWLPQMKRTRRHARRVDVVESPVFPGYLFVELDLARDIWSPINGTPGVRRLLCQKDQPSRVPDGFIVALRQTIEAGDLVDPSEETLRPGQKVRLVSGPFADSMGVLLRLAPKDRIALMLNVLGTDVVTYVPRRFVTKAD